MPFDLNGLIDKRLLPYLKSVTHLREGYRIKLKNGAGIVISRNVFTNPDQEVSKAINNWIAVNTCIVIKIY